MTLAEIRDECRARARDTALVDADRLWPNADMNRIINRIYRHFARETQCIRDSETVAVCMIASAPVDYTTYTVGTKDYIWANDANSWLYHKNVCPYLFSLHTSIIRVEEVKWTSRQWKLQKVSCTKWQTNPWWEQVVGMPTEYATDLTVGKLAVNFRDETSDNLSLVVRRLPLTALSNDNDVPEFRSNYHDLMWNGILWQMYSTQDSDAINPAKAAEHYKLYLQDLDEVKQMESTLDERLRPNYAMKAFR